MFLSSKFCADILLVNINKDELKEFASKTFSAISVDDITHITNLISESALSEENKFVYFCILLLLIILVFAGKQENNIIKMRSIQRLNFKKKLLRWVFFSFTME